jgi:hypothetical protein
MHRSIALSPVPAIWASNAHAHGGEVVIAFAIYAAMMMVIFVLFLILWRASLAQKLVLVLAFVGSYPLSWLVAFAVERLAPSAPTWLLLAILLSVPVAFVATIAWALTTKPNPTKNLNTGRGGHRPVRSS